MYTVACHGCTRYAQYTPPQTTTTTNNNNKPLLSISVLFSCVQLHVRVWTNIYKGRPWYSFADLSKSHFAKSFSVTSVLKISTNLGKPIWLRHLNVSAVSRSASLFLYFYACNWDQMDPTVSAAPCKDSTETSTSSSISDAISFSTFHASVESLLKQWPTTGPWRRKLTSQSDTACRQLRRLPQASFAQQDLPWTSAKKRLRDGLAPEVLYQETSRYIKNGFYTEYVPHLHPSLFCFHVYIGMS